MEVTIEPKTKLLSAAELTSLRHTEVITKTKVGLKRLMPTETNEEREQLQQLYDELHQQMSTPRIDRMGGRALAFWDGQTVCVQRKDGKFGNFGYHQNGKHYLEDYEAMFLLELGRLQLEYNSMVVSVEQAYLLLFGESKSSKFNEYLVYSSFMRAGYIVVKHTVEKQELNNATDDGAEHSKATEEQKEPSTATDEKAELTNSTENKKELIKAAENDCIWELLLSHLYKRPTSKYVKTLPFYTKFEQNMAIIRTRIMRQQDCTSGGAEEEQTITFDKKVQSLGKRKSNKWPTSNERADKRRRRSFSHVTPNKSFVDNLKDDAEYKAFKHMFAKLDIIPLKPRQLHSSNCRRLRIKFDVHLHNAGFRKSTPQEPVFGLIVLDPEDLFPNHDEISNCFQQQRHPLPLLIASISGSKQIHAFLYHFT